MLLFYVRHGEPIYNPDSLTPFGKRQAEAVGKRLAVHGIDKIFASPSVRAYETALPLSELTKKEIVKLDYFCESEAWKYFAIPYAENKCTWAYYMRDIKKLFASDEVYRLGQKWYEHPVLSKYKFREGVEFFNKSFDGFMLSLGYEHNRETHTYKALRENNDRVAVFAHEGMGSVFLSYLLDIPYPLFASHYTLSHTGVTVIKFDASGEEILPLLMMHSNDSHIYKEGLPTNFINTIPI